MAWLAPSHQYTHAANKGQKLIMPNWLIIIKGGFNQQACHQLKKKDYGGFYLWSSDITDEFRDSFESQYLCVPYLLSFCCWHHCDHPLAHSSLAKYSETQVKGISSFYVHPKNHSSSFFCQSSQKESILASLHCCCPSPASSRDPEPESGNFYHQWQEKLLKPGHKSS